MPPVQSSPPSRPGPEHGGGRGRDRRPWWERRRDKLAAEIARERNGAHRVPTWVMAVALVVIVGGWIGLILLV
jgi:hypothetical protein